ncbi:MAG: hypothetical protein HY221_00695 [Candidatus Sungbacteria bacterium]|uniref:Uncharacterized protein n=1 Tax=Candidatus Sungiibacteriota bacterium TaxID=2750080 RepID=A0A932QXY8_9BACT|nr:hypothetical protein [Candidatus Sungbacteria bacterium]
MIISARQKLVGSLLALVLLAGGIGLAVQRNRLKSTAEQGNQAAKAMTVAGRALKKDGSPVKGVVLLSGGSGVNALQQARLASDGSFTFSNLAPSRYALEVHSFKGEIWCQKNTFESGQFEVSSDPLANYFNYTNLEVCDTIPGVTGPEDDTTPPKITFKTTGEADLGKSVFVSFTVEDPGWGNRFGQILGYYRYGTDGKWQFAKVTQDTADKTKFTASMPKRNDNPDIFYFIQAGGAGGVLFSQYPDKGATEPAKIARTPAPTATLTASPTQITSGQSTTLTWSSTNATSCVGTAENPGASQTELTKNWTGTSASSGSVNVSPITNATVDVKYLVTCTGPGGSGGATVTVKVTSAAAVGVTLTASPSTIAAGQRATLSWSSTNADNCFWEVPPPNTSTAPGPTSGSVTVQPNATASYTMGCSGKSGSKEASATVTVNGVAAPPTVTLTANPTVGTYTTLTWSSTGARNCNGTSTNPARTYDWSQVGGITPTSGSVFVFTAANNPNIDAETFTMTCTNTQGVSQSASVEVRKK